MVNRRDLYSIFASCCFRDRLRNIVSISTQKLAIKLLGTERLRFFTAKKQVTALRIAAMSYPHGKR